MDVGYSDAATESGLSCLGKATARAAGPCQPSRWKRDCGSGAKQVAASIICLGEESDLLSIAAVSAGDRLGGIYHTSGGQGDTV